MKFLTWWIQPEYYYFYVQSYDSWLSVRLDETDDNNIALISDTVKINIKYFILFYQGF